jgi:PKD repeat protein
MPGDNNTSYKFDSILITPNHIATELNHVAVMRSTSTQYWSWILLFVIVLSETFIVLSLPSINPKAVASAFLSPSTTQSSNRPPHAVSGGPYTGIEDIVLQFDGSASCDPDGVIATYYWLFGDNTTATTAKPNKQYQQEGNYTVSLTVTDNKGATTSQTTYAIISDQSPSPNFIGSPLQGPTPLLVQFTDQSSSHDGVIAWHWEFDDNSTSSITHPQHTYTLSGLYSVTLTVTEADGDHETITKSNYINVSQPTSPPTHTSPTVITPSSTPIVTAGTPVNQTIIVKNNDAPPLNQSTFYLSTTIPANWTASIDSPIITIDPGANASIILTFSSPSITLPQQYNFTINVHNIDQPHLQTNLSLPVEVVRPPSEHAPPSITVSPPHSIGLHFSAEYDINIRNNDAPSFSPTAFTINTTVPTNWTSNTNPSTLTLAPGESAITTLTITAPSTTTPQNYTFMVTVIHGANTSYNSTATGIFVVKPQNGETPSNEEPLPTKTALNVSVHIEPETPTSNQPIIFTIQTNASTDTDAQIRIYIDDVLLNQDVLNGTYLYESGPLSIGPHTFHIEIEDEQGVITQIPANNTLIFTVTSSESSLPSFSWQGLVLAFLPLLILNGLSYIFNPKRPKKNAH